MNDNTECTKSELDLFSIPPTQTSIEEGKWDIVYPDSGYVKNKTISFNIAGTDSHYLDLSETQLFMEVKIIDPKQDNDKGYSSKEVVAPVNNILHSMFSQIKVKFNNKDVENSNGNYHYKSYFENLLSYGTEAKSTFLENEGWQDDTPGLFDLTILEPTQEVKETGTQNITTHAIPNCNEGFIKRHQKYKDKKLIQLCGKIHSDIFNINKYLLNSVNVSIELFKNDNKILLMGKDADKFDIRIESAHLKVRRVTISPSVMLGHAMVMEKTRAKYPLKRVLVQGFPYEFASTTFEKSIHVGVMPTRVLVGLIKTETVTGDILKNPFNFEHFNVKSLMLKAASASLPYSTELNFMYSENKYMEAYNTLFTNLRDTDTNISYEDYAKGNTIYAFDLTPDLCNSGHYNVMRNGSLNLSIKLEKAILGSITIMTYMEFDNILEIDNKRNTFLDYSL